VLIRVLGLVWSDPVKWALVFPGQGAEEAGMGVALAAMDARARRLLALASDATKIDVVRALDRGGRALTRTDVLQPVLVAVSLGAAHALADRGHVPDVVLGHSLGELAAACFALDVDDETAIALAAERGRLMAEAADAHPGGMVALSSRDPAPEGLVLAAHNADDEHVFSGDLDAVERVARTRSDATRLRVSGAWHSLAMAPVVEPLRVSFARALTGRASRVPLLSAVDARVMAPSEIPLALARGIVGPVQWATTLRALSPLGIERIVLAPPGRLSRALVRRVLGATVDARAIETPKDFER
jgi:[acyl-carrier-protein] S-malonyltransferase